jgi:hypothetical protein
MGVLCIHVSGCSTRTLVSSEEGHAVTPPADAGSPTALPPLPGAATADDAPLTGPFYEPDPQGRPVVILRGDAPNMRYAHLTPEACMTEIGKRAIKTEAVPKGMVTGVASPLWLRGNLNGIFVHSPLAPSAREHSSAEVFDCRLVLALDDFAALAASHDVVEIVHLSAYRPRSSFGCTPKYDGKQHCAALAVDIGSFKKKDGTVMHVERDFHGHVGLGTCAPNVGPKPASKNADELWGFVCDSARRATFNVILTPNYNVQHKNHFHLEITPDAGWMLIH